MRFSKAGSLSTADMTGRTQERRFDVGVVRKYWRSVRIAENSCVGIEWCLA